MSESKSTEESGQSPTENDDKNEVFSSKLGLICSCLGCVVGTGNIWRFPKLVAQNSEDEGGLVFLIVWFSFLLLWSIPMSIIEYSTGRYTKKAIVQSFREFGGDKVVWCGAWITFVSYAISCYYSVVLGWCFYYLVRSIGWELPTDHEEAYAVFHDFADDDGKRTAKRTQGFQKSMGPDHVGPVTMIATCLYQEKSYWPILTHGIAVVLGGALVFKGVKEIERVNMVLIPILLSIIAFLFIWVLTTPFAGRGITFLFTPNWASFGNPRLWVDAISQNAFDTGAGSGLMIPYATYMTRRHGIVKYGSLIPATNNLVSLICGMLIFSTVFGTLTRTEPLMTQPEIVRILKESGPASTGLTFIWIPVLFSTFGIFGRILCVFFFLCLSFAGLSSLIANIELAAHTFEDFGVPRKYGDPITVVLIFGVGLMSALNLEILTNQDFAWGFALLVNGLMLQFMVVKFGAEKWRKLLVNDFSLDDWHLPVLWQWIVKFIAPLEAVVILVWWIVSMVTKKYVIGQHWYDFNAESLFTTLVQWFGVMSAMILINVAIVICKPRWFTQATLKRGSKLPYEELSSETADEKTRLRDHYKVVPSDRYETTMESRH